MKTIEFKQRNLKQVKILLLPFAIYMVLYFWILSSNDRVIEWINQYSGPALGLALIFATPVFLPLFLILVRMRTSTTVSFDEQRMTIQLKNGKQKEISYSQIQTLKLNHPLPNTLTVSGSDNKVIYTFRPMNNDTPNNEILDELVRHINFRIDLLPPVKYFKVTFESRTYTRI
ncbi:hypothetical protein HMPREF0765_4115 [Sphingobacterium spiritivorum ATCC 33300]|uniref:Uncharacterized protein n=1 Tax=Sphingobacterium spiritivorum ATCC 33300 TaxID=525372 RepID=C2G3F9_SPHSI|nr:hypothetical protein [Sphingobacterium spiritivorum]EEI90164.1 hypothetical protein HMPREF0765_4115 [Sphingobacterium spiritivorum ATCC 33300]QQS95194.1 hypothetical protein I6J03_17690 [Sphingobacterium spiritivorum]